MCTLLIYIYNPRLNKRLKREMCDVNRKMKSEELFFEDLNFFRFFSSAAAKKRSSFSPLFSPFSLLFFSLCGTNTNNQKRRLFRELVVSKKLS